MPQAVRRVIPPLLNDFIALQKDVALVSILGPQEAFRVAQIFAASHFNYTPLLAAAALYLCVTIPLTRIVDRLQARSLRERGAALALGPAMSAVLELRGVTKAYGDHLVLRGIDLAVGEHEAIALIGPRARASRRCCAASTCSRRSTTATSCSTASRSPPRASIRCRSAAGSASSSRPTTCSPTDA